MKTGGKILLGITGVAAAALIAAGILWFKGYYDGRYKLEDYYYTVVPGDYEIKPYQARDSDGREVGIIKATYQLTGYNADGKARELEFDVSLDMQGFYPPGTYIRVGMSELWATGKNALPEDEVPKGAMEQLRKDFSPSAAKTLGEYADERTLQLASRNTPSLTITCASADDTLVYSYVYAIGAKALATQAAALLDPVYNAQFRTDKQILPALKAIFLEVRLEDGTVIFSQKYDKRVEFGYEKEGGY